MKKIVLLALGLVAVTTTHAQDKIETTVSGDIVSSYIWRGLDAGSTAIQPTLGIGYKGLSLTAWGSYGLTNPDDVKEFDLSLGYTTGGFSIGITDYWFRAISSTTPMVPTTSSRPPSDMTSDQSRYSGIQTLQAMMASTRTASALIAAILRLMSHSNLPHANGLPLRVLYPIPPHFTERMDLQSPTWL